MPQKSSTIAVKSHNEILILKRGKTAPYMPERYCLPGGMLDDGESLEQCCIRELYEETGIVVEQKDIKENTIIYKNGSSKKVFSVNMNNPVVMLNWEHSHYAWVNSKTMDKYKLVPGLRTTLKYLLDS